MKSHVNSGRGNILKFFLHKSSRGIQNLVLKYQGWNLKRSFYYFGVFPLQSWTKLIIFLCLSLLTAKQTCPCVLLLEKMKNYFFKQHKMRELSFTVFGTPQKSTNEFWKIRQILFPSATLELCGPDASFVFGNLKRIQTEFRRMEYNERQGELGCLEKKSFRGSDPIVWTDPIVAFQYLKGVQ